MASLATPAAAVPPGRLRVPGPVGTVDTIAGPGFCAGPTVADRASHRVGALAASANAEARGVVWYESGSPDQGLLTKVLSSASVVVERTGAAGPGNQGRSRPEGAAALAAASRIAPDGLGGTLFAKPTAIVQFATGSTTVAGSPTEAAGAGGAGTGDGGPLLQARFRRLLAIATDNAGNAYVAEELDSRRSEITIRFVNRSPEPVSFYPGTPQEIAVAPGTIDTVAGSGAAPGSASLVAVAPVLAVAQGRLYLAASQTGPRPRAAVRVINLGGAELDAHAKKVSPGATATVATVVGGQRVGSGGSGRSHSVSPLPGIAADGAGNLFLAESANHRIRRLGPDGKMTAFAGTGAPGFNGNDRPAVTARLDRPYDVELGAGGRLYISDAGNDQVRYVDSGGVIHAALGNGAAHRSICAGSAISDVAGARDQPNIGQPVSAAAARSGEVYLTGPSLSKVHRLGVTGGIRPFLGGSRGASCAEAAGCGAGGVLGDEARLEQPLATALGPSGGVYVQDAHGVHFVNPGREQLRVNGVAVAAGTIQIVAGGGRAAGTPPAIATDQRAVGASIGTGLGLAAIVADRKGNLFVADSFNRSVRQVDSRGVISTLLAGPSARVASGHEPGCCSCCATPTGLALDRGDNLYISDLLTLQVWFLNRGTTTVSVHGVSVSPGAVVPIAGVGRGGGSDVEGIAALEAQLAPLGLAADSAGNLYVTHGHTVRRVDANGTVTTVVGTGQQGFNGDGLKGALTALSYPNHLAIDACGNLIIADSRNDRLRRFNLVATCSAAGSPAAPAAARRPLGAVLGISLGVVALSATAVGFRRRRSGRRRRQVLDLSPSQDLHRFS